MEYVLRDEQTDIFDGIVIDVRLGPGGLHFVDAPDVGEIHEGAVTIAVPAARRGAAPEAVGDSRR